jgi:hypothetical protein
MSDCVEKDADRIFKIAVVCESPAEENSKTELPQQSSYAPQHSGVVIDDKDDISIWQKDDFRRAVLHAASKDCCGL